MHWSQKNLPGKSFVDYGTTMSSSAYLRNEGDVNSCVRSDQLDQNLSSDVSQEVLDVLTDERVLHDGLPVW